MNDRSPWTEPAQEPLLESMQFQFPLRTYQKQILSLVEQKLGAGEKQMHIVAPPGAGKTILGLQIISQLKRPSLILSPNTTIQSQWGQKVHNFLPPNDAAFGTADLIGTDKDRPLKPITMLTYQVLSTPGKEQEYLEKLAHDSWVKELTQGRSISMGEAELRILDLLRNNPKAHHKEISRHVSRLRRQLSEVLDLKEVLHENAIELLQTLRRQKFGVVIFDECHHLTDYWAAIMTHLVKVLGDPIVIGLTGTPPEGKTASQETRYLSLVGDIDYQVPTPALVREGGLAPFQDLVYFTEPTEREFQFLEQQHEEFHYLIEELMCPPGEWLLRSPQKAPAKEISSEEPAVEQGSVNAADADSLDDFAPGIIVGGYDAFGSVTYGLHSGGASATADHAAEHSNEPLTAYDVEPPRVSNEATQNKVSPANDVSKKQAETTNTKTSASSKSVPVEALSPTAMGLPKAALSEIKGTLPASEEEQLPALTLWVRDKVFEAVKNDVIRFQPLSGGSLAKTNERPASGKISFDKGLLPSKNAANAKGGSKKRPSKIEKKAAPVKEATKAVLVPGGWTELWQNHPELAQSLCRYLWKVGIKLPRNIQVSEALLQSPTIDDWMRILDDFGSHKLKVSSSADDHALFKRICTAARKLGYGITEQGVRKQASPVDRVLAFSGSKPNAVAEIIEVEYKLLQERLRCVVVTDFETMSATSVKALGGVLDEESGGAVACLKILLSCPISEYVNPCLVTGSLLLVDDRIVDKFAEASNEYLKNEGHSFTVNVEHMSGSGFARVSANTGLWQSKLYVGMVTAIFERGITKCMVGTRGLFGEGWDSQALNTLIDLTTTTSPVSVKQLRGRSIRIQTNDPLAAHKVANNWDVVCIAPQLEKGLNDYHRFARKHDCFFGMADDGHIERGVGHVHPAFSELTPIEVFSSFERFNQEMVHRSLMRENIYELWKVGQPYKNRMLGCVELSNLRQLALTPPNIRKDMNYPEHAKRLRNELRSVWIEYSLIGCVAAGVFAVLASGLGVLSPIAAVSALGSMLFAAYKKVTWLSAKIRKEVCAPNSQDSSLIDVGTAVMTALQRRKFLPLSITREQIKISARADGTYRVFLDGLEPEQSDLFVKSFEEAMAPITNQPYIIPKYEYFIGAPEPEYDEDGNAINSGAPAEVTNYELKEHDFFKQYLAGQAKPRIAAYHPVPSLLARSDKGRAAFESAWNKYVSPGFVTSTEAKPELLNRYFAIGPSLAQRVLWE